jgi:hypothetical protein
MKFFSAKEAGPQLEELLDLATIEDVVVERRGQRYLLTVRLDELRSPFDIEGIKTQATMSDILEAVSLSRSDLRQSGIDEL